MLLPEATPIIMCIVYLSSGPHLCSQNYMDTKELCDLMFADQFMNLSFCRTGQFMAGL